MAEDALELFKIVSHHMMRPHYKDVTVKPDQRLGQTEAHDVRMMPIADRHRLAMRMLQRITCRQRKAGIDVSRH
eukprot:14223581-Alexandrium_andersonii.AAC.1